MIASIKFTDSAQSKLFVTGCLHLNHNKEFIYKDRGYNSAAEHTDSVIDKINETCNKDDVLLVLGDFCLNTLTIDDFISLTKRIHPSIWMLRGNHNSPWEKGYLEHSLATFGYEVLNWRCGALNFRYMGDYLEFNWNKKDVVCFHYPIQVFNNSKRDWWHIHSHNHGKLQSSRPECLDNGKILDVGWDVFKKPVDFGGLKSIMYHKTRKCQDGLH
jgi:calcineurin-like phosphoesterase family protein